jgi:hypothetical protein
MHAEWLAEASGVSVEYTPTMKVRERTALAYAKVVHHGLARPAPFMTTRASTLASRWTPIAKRLGRND